MKSMNSHAAEAEIHKIGVQKMVKAGGGMSKLGMEMDGFLTHLITL